MCVDRLASVAVLDPSDEQAPAIRGPPAHQPVPFAFRIWHFFSLGIGHCLFDVGDYDASLWVILLDVIPIGAVPDDRPIVHSNQYTSTGYTLGIGCRMQSRKDGPASFRSVNAADRS